MADVKAYQAAYREANRERLREYQREYRKKYPNKVKAGRTKQMAKRKANPEKRSKQEHGYRKKAMAEGRSIVGWVKKRYEGIACVDCCRVYPWIAMDFDHRPEEEKKFNVSRLGQYLATSERIAAVEKEIAKCDLVCSNCHRIRGQERQEKRFE
jgi:hypothetical protein